MKVPVLNVEDVVRERYSAASHAREAALCCPIDYDPQYLEVIPQAVIDRDYGCGDPSRYARPGDTVLDLGSGGGKACFIAAQIVGAAGAVVGVDMNDDMLALARASAPEVGDNIGYHNTRFFKGRIQDLSLDVDALDRWLTHNPVDGVAGYARMEQEIARMRREAPLIADGSVDLIISNCVLNLVDDAQKAQLIEEIYRVLKVGGRIAISDIVSDEAVPASLKADPELWSGCISGAFQERELLEMLEAAGFYGIAIDQWQAAPWQTVGGIEFRSVTVTAFKGKEGRCLEANQAIIYKGPWKQVVDDDGHVFPRGERVAVCEKTFRLMTAAPYEDAIIGISPQVVPEAAALAPFTCVGVQRRDPRETRGAAHHVTLKNEGGSCC
ncbi:MAG: methyltransferase domain-containing protein [Myxococcota bacterium]